MKKRSLIIVLLLSSILMQYCKKSSDSTDTSTTTTSTVLFQAYLNGVIWTPRSTSAILTYNATAKTKTFVWTAIDSVSNEILLINKQPATKVDSGFTVKTYNADSVNVYTTYNILNSSKVYVPSGQLKSGNITITAVDSVKKVITGTFSFNQAKLNYDSKGNITSITSTGVTSGQFNNLPYTFKKQ